MSNLLNDLDSRGDVTEDEELVVKDCAALVYAGMLPIKGMLYDEINLLFSYL